MYKFIMFHWISRLLHHLLDYHNSIHSLASFLSPFTNFHSYCIIHFTAFYLQRVFSYYMYTYIDRQHWFGLYPSEYIMSCVICIIDVFFYLPRTLVWRNPVSPTTGTRQPPHRGDCTQLVKGSSHLFKGKTGKDKRQIWAAYTSEYHNRSG